jgi:hypothetical protein
MNLHFCVFLGQNLLTVRANVVEGKRQLATLGTTYNISCDINATTGASLSVVAYLMTTFRALYNSHNDVSFSNFGAKIVIITEK